MIKIFVFNLRKIYHHEPTEVSVDKDNFVDVEMTSKAWDSVPFDIHFTDIDTGKEAEAKTGVCRFKLYHTYAIITSDKKLVGYTYLTDRCENNDETFKYVLRDAIETYYAKVITRLQGEKIQQLNVIR